MKVIASDIHNTILDHFRKGMVIPAVPLALDRAGRFDEKHQRALIRYYMDAGAGGLAVGVHTTQFAIRNPEHGLFEPLLAFCSEVIDSWGEKRGRKPMKIAGICGATPQAVREAEKAVEHGYHAGLVSLADGRGMREEELAGHCRTVSGIIPVIGFYLQPAVGGVVLSYNFWRMFADIENILAVKIAPFNRYQTLDVIRAVADSGRDREITLYTGNDDHIVEDLLTSFRIKSPRGTVSLRIRGGLLGQWAVWTRKAVEQLYEIHRIMDAGAQVKGELLTRAAEITDANGAIFDASHNFAGCIPGIHEVLRRQGLLQSRRCLDPGEELSGGQMQEIDRVCASYPHLNDDDFISENLESWLRE